MPKRWLRSTPAITGGRCGAVGVELDLGVVSIHARHYWRAMPLEPAAARAGTVWFQSTPAITGGRCAAPTLLHRPCCRFNPRPPLLAGDAIASACRHSGADSFNPRPPLLAGDAVVLLCKTRADDVSIHARHYWRAMHWLRCAGLLPWLVSIHARHYWRAMRGVVHHCLLLRVVSIHARHYWRAMPHAGASRRQRCDRFNPRPPLLAGDATRAWLAAS